MARKVAWGIVLVVLGFIGCKPRVPSQYLDPGEMEDVLYDYHLADGIAYYDGQSGSTSERQMTYRMAALEKHGVTQALLDSSLTYYFRHTEELKTIYEKVAQRLSDEAISLGASANDIRLYGEEGMRGDTSNIWVGPHTAILLPNSPNNIIKFHLKADTAFHAGDKVMLVFDSQFIIQEGSRDAVAMLSLRFNNDSVAKMQMNISSNNHYSLQLADREHLGIKEVRGFVFIPTPLSDKMKTTLKILSLSNIKAVKMHEKEMPKPDTPTDSLNASPVKTGLRGDTLGPTSRETLGKPTPQVATPATTNNPPATQAGKKSTEKDPVVHGKPKRSWVSN